MRENDTNGRTPEERAMRADGWLGRLHKALGQISMIHLLPASPVYTGAWVRPVIVVNSTVPEDDPRFKECERLAAELFSDPELEWAVQRKLPQPEESWINHGRRGIGARSSE